MPVQLRLSERRLASLWRPLVLIMTASLLGAMLLVSQPASRGFAQSTTILIQPSSSYVNVGDTVTVDIRIEDVPDGDDGLYGVDVQLSFDPALLEVQDADGNPANGVQIEVGSFPAPDVIANNKADNSAGTIWYAVSQRNDLHPDPVSGSGTLASITFKGLAVGTSPVAFTYQKMVNKDGEQIPATVQDGEVGATGILIQPSSSNMPVGDTVTVDIRIEAVTDLYGVDVRLSFDPTLLEVQDADGNPANGVQIQEGSFPAPDVVVNNEADNSAGTIWYAVSQRNDLHPDPVSGSGVAASVTFKGLTIGTSSVAFTYQKMVNKDGEQIPATTQSGQITVRAISIGDRVWNDQDGDGDQTGDWDVEGFNGVEVYLFRDDGDGVFEPGTTGADRDGNFLYVTTTISGTSQEPPDYPNGIYGFDITEYDKYWVWVNESTLPGPGSGMQWASTTSNNPFYLDYPDGDDFSIDFGYVESAAGAAGGKIGDRVWHDQDGDGYQTGGWDVEGFNDVDVYLYSSEPITCGSSTNLIAHTTTTSGTSQDPDGFPDGIYEFNGVSLGLTHDQTYWVCVKESTLPSPEQGKQWTSTTDNPQSVTYSQATGNFSIDLGYVATTIPTAIALSSFAARPSAGLKASLAWPWLVGVAALAVGGVLWIKRRR